MYICLFFCPQNTFNFCESIIENFITNTTAKISWDEGCYQRLVRGSGNKSLREREFVIVQVKFFSEKVHLGRDIGFA